MNMLTVSERDDVMNIAPKCVYFSDSILDLGWGKSRWTRARFW